MARGSRETGTRDATAQGRAARKATRAGRRLQIDWIVIPAVIVVIFVLGFGAKLLFG
jgi:hypothetical protein